MPLSAQFGRAKYIERKIGWYVYLTLYRTAGYTWNLVNFLSSLNSGH